jgi:hypothetical protein
MASAFNTEDNLKKHTMRIMYKINVRENRWCNIETAATLTLDTEQAETKRKAQNRKPKG